MRAKARDQRRQAAKDRTASSVLTQAERDRIWQQAWAMVKHAPRTPRRVKTENARQIYTSLCAELEARKSAKPPVVQPAQTTGLVVPRSSLLITPEEARQIGRRFGP
jgi:hypothetical protein